MTEHPHIQFDDVTLVENVAPVGRAPRRRTVLRGVSLDIPIGRYVVTGDEADRRCVIDLLVGRRIAHRGRVRIQGRCSYAIGRTGPFAVPARGRDVVAFMANVYGFDAALALERLTETLPWPEILNTRLDKSEPAARLALSILLAEFIDADIVVVDGALAHPQFPEVFLQEIGALLVRILPGRLAILSSRQMNVMRPLASATLKIEAHTLTLVEGDTDTGLGLSAWEDRQDVAGLLEEAE
jgi:capsular polysaccharide transport system ATP-binding protein